MPAMWVRPRSCTSSRFAFRLAGLLALSYGCHAGFSCEAEVPRHDSPVAAQPAPPVTKVAATAPSTHRAAKLIAIKVPKLLGRVNDYAHVLSDAERSALEAKLRAHEQRTGQQFAVAVWNEPLGEQSITDVGFTVAESWGLGRAGHDDGLLIVVAPREHKVDIEVGLGLESVVSDERAARVIAERMAPRFREGKYAAGLEDAFDELIPLTEAKHAKP